MTIRFASMKALAVVISVAWAGTPARLLAQQAVDPAVAELGEGFISSTAEVNGTTLHYVRGGTGPAAILPNGFPQDWYEFHQVIPRLAKRFDRDRRGSARHRRFQGHSRRLRCCESGEGYSSACAAAEAGARLPSGGTIWAGSLLTLSPGSIPTKHVAS
jgi:hypothetical protein